MLKNSSNRADGQQEPNTARFGKGVLMSVEEAIESLIETIRQEYEPE